MDRAKLWALAESISDEPLVNEALTNFAHDACADNATGVVIAVMEAYAVRVIDDIKEKYPRLGEPQLPVGVEEAVNIRSNRK